MSLSGSGQELWSRAQRVIPGGGQLLSKRMERFLPGLWPSYYRKAQGCTVWDCQGNEYLDFAQMGVGTCALGYADLDVNAAVISAIAEGSMSSLNCYEEIELAEKLVSLHPWADMVRFARTGGEACAIAVRIGRAATRKDKVAFCGYHGWHDWYLAANLADESNLDGQLLPGLEPRGVPRNLRNTALPFHYNNLAELEALVSAFPDEIGVIILEPLRGAMPQPGFLEGVRAIASRIGAVLIFDEVTSGFRMNLGGIHLSLGTEPDIAILGKALGNGFPISAVVGRKTVMDHAQETFMSSTFWTERVGFVAALATLEKMARENVQAALVHYGNLINKGWEESAQRHGLGVTISGIPPLTHISFLDGPPMVMQTLYAQDMLTKGFLLGSAVYTTYAYSENIIEKFNAASNSSFKFLRMALDSGDPARHLKNGVIQTGFKRLT